MFKRELLAQVEAASHESRWRRLNPTLEKEKGLSEHLATSVPAENRGAQAEPALKRSARGIGRREPAGRSSSSTAKSGAELSVSSGGAGD